MISMTGLVLNVLAAALVLEHYFFLAGIAFIVGSIMDTLDGRYSRMSGKGTPFGAFLDSTLDRIEEGIVLMAVAGGVAADGHELAGAAGGAGGLFSLLGCSTPGPGGALGGGGQGGLAPHAGPGGGARSRVQGRHRDARGSCRYPLCRPSVREDRHDRGSIASRVGHLRAGVADDCHDSPASSPRPARAGQAGSLSRLQPSEESRVGNNAEAAA